VAKGTYSPQREAYVCVYVVRTAEYLVQARDDFSGRVIPKLRRWFEQQIAKPDTALLGYDQMIVEWDGTTHRFHELTLHTGLSGRRVVEGNDSFGE
jgi:hypothetical protein